MAVNTRLCDAEILMCFMCAEICRIIMVGQSVMDKRFRRNAYRKRNKQHECNDPLYEMWFIQLLLIKVKITI
jgi:hypothetical protein